MFITHLLEVSVNVQCIMDLKLQRLFCPGGNTWIDININCKHYKTKDFEINLTNPVSKAPQPLIHTGSIKYRLLKIKQFNAQRLSE